MAGLPHSFLHPKVWKKTMQHNSALNISPESTIIDIPAFYRQMWAGIYIKCPILAQGFSARSLNKHRHHHLRSQMFVLTRPFISFLHPFASTTGHGCTRKIREKSGCLTSFIGLSKPERPRALVIPLTRLQASHS